MIKKIVAWIGMILFILGVMSADSPNLAIPYGMVISGIILFQLGGGQENL